MIALGRGFGAVLVDAPRCDAALRDAADRVYVCANPDPASAAATVAVFDDVLRDGARLVVSQARERDASLLTSRFGVPPTFVLPPDEPALRDAMTRRGRVAGRLGRAYDAIAEIFLADLAA